MEKGNKSDPAKLRQKAEKLLKKKTSKTALHISEAETLKLIHELEVHQIELELINEELTLAKEQAAEIATEKYAELYDFAPSGYFTLSREGKIIDLNLCGSQMLGKERSLLKNSLFGFFVSSETKPIFNLFLGKVFNDKVKETCEVTLSTNHNVQTYGYLTGIITENKEQCLVTAIDITERIKAEGYLKESENKYRNLFDNDLAGNFITTADGEIQLCNLAFAKIFGFSSVKDALHFNVTRLYKTAEERKQFIKDLKKKKKITLFEKEFIRPDGKTITVLLNVVGEFEENNELLRIIGYLFDISGRKKTEEELKVSTSLYKLLSENMTDTIWLMDLNLKTTYISPSMEKLRGYPFEKIKKLPLKRQLTPESLQNAIPVFMEELAKVKADPDYSFNFILELEFYRKDGSTLWSENTFSIVRDENGLPVSILGEGRDITERMHDRKEIKKLNAELEQRVIDRTAQLEASNEELEAFSYSVSHDLRAPLRHINGYVELLSHCFHDSLPEKEKHYLGSIAESAHQMGTLIDNLLQFSRTGRQEMQQTKVDMNDILQEALKIIDQDTKGRRIEWIFARLPNVFGDNNLLLLVWINLLSNAVKFTRPKKKARIETRFREEDNEYLFFVRDNGVGFDMQYADKLFGVFQRLHSSAEFEGTGIGLANVRRIINKHGGRTWVEAKLNEGATFYFSIPKLAPGTRHLPRERIKNENHGS